MISRFTFGLLSALLLILLFPPFDIHWFAPIALTPLLIAIAREPVWWRRLLIGELAGIVYWYGVCHWIRFVLITHGDMSEPLSWFSIALFSLAKGGHFAVFALAAGPLIRLRWFAAPAVAALWIGIERTNGPGAFAWLTLGNAAIDMGLPMRLAPWLGVYGPSFILALMAATVALALLRRPRVDLAPILILPLLFLVPALPDAKPGTESAVSLQPNLSQRSDWTSESVRQMTTQLDLLTTQSALEPGFPPPRLLLWPEVPAPVYYFTDPAFKSEATALARVTRTPFLFGTVAYAPSGAPLNSAVLLDASGNFVSRYDKMYLVPFGEFVPSMFTWVNRITNESGDFEPGKAIVVSTVNGHRIGTFLCYESAFPHQVRHFSAAGAEVLVNLTNDGYFGRTRAREQHLLIARMRAAENNRWVLRPTNDGITVSIDPAGRIVNRHPEHQQRAGRLSFSWISEQTFYTRHGDWFTWTCLAVTLVLALVMMLRRPSPKP